MPFVESVIYFQYDGSEYFGGRVQVPDRDWIGRVVEEARRC